MGKFERLYTFLLAAEDKNFTKVGKQLGISNVAVSKQINALESEVGMQLFIRSTKQVILTEAGEICYERAKKIAHEMQEMDALFSELRFEPAGPLKVGTSRFFAEKFIIPNLPEFLNKYSKIEMTLEYLERPPDLAKEELDVNIGHRYVGGPNDIIRRVGSSIYVLCASPQYLTRFGVPKHPQDLQKHRYLTHRMRNPDNVLIFDKGLEILVKPYLYFNDSLFMKSSALQGLGIIKLHKYAVAEELKRGTLVEVLQGFDTSEQVLYLAYQPYRHLQAKIRAFIDFFVPKISLEDFQFYHEDTQPSNL